MIERDQDGTLHVVALSGGHDSTALAFLLREREPRPYCYLCTPTGDELPEMFDHWRRLGELLGRRLIPIMQTEHPGLFAWSRHKKLIPNRTKRHCTPGLKIEPFVAWLQAQLSFGPVVAYVGLRADEEARAGGAYGAIDGIELRYPLREWGFDDPMVHGTLARLGITVPDRTDCARCYHQQLGEWWRLWKDHRALFIEAVEFEAEMGQTFRTPKLESGEPVMVTRYGLTYAACWRDTWPVRLGDMMTLFEAGHVPMNRGDPRARDLLKVGACRVCSL
ncbi:MAG: hypothetical protein QOI38_711 [Sphingomonadales bacterium]|nr:hypothetical protein [Sphingomonadales bacterium]